MLELVSYYSIVCKAIVFNCCGCWWPTGAEEAGQRRHAGRERLKGSKSEEAVN